MKKRKLPIPILLILAIFITPVFAENSSSAVDTSQTEAQKLVLIIKYENGLLSADIKSSSIKEIFEELKKQTGMTYEIEKEIQEQKVSISLKDKELTQAIKDILNTIGNPSYMLSYKKDKSEKYVVSGITIRKRGATEATQTTKRELQSGEMEIEKVNDPKWKYNFGKYRIRAKDVDVNELWEKLSSLGEINEKIVADKIDKIIDFDGEEAIIILVDDIINKLRPKIYKVNRISSERDKDGKIIKPGYIQVTKMTEAEIRQRRKEAEQANKEGETLMKQGRYREALSAFEHSSGGLDPDYISPLKNLARIYLKANQSREVLGYLNEALEITKDDSEVYFLLGETYQATNQMNLAVANYERSIEIEKDEKKKNITKNILEKLSSSKVKDFYAKMNEGDEFGKQNKIIEAELAYKKAMDIDPENKSVYIKLGKFYTDKKDYLKAIEVYERFKKQSPKDYDSYMYLGLIYRDMGKYKEAINEMESAGKLVSETGVKQNIEFMINQIKEHLKEVKNK